MGQLHKPLPVKLFIGMLSSDPEQFFKCADIFCREYGRIDFQSEIMPWEITDYYQEEMGSNIFRKFVFFRELIDPSGLPGIKLFTNSIEEKFSLVSSSGPRRIINLDPGYITESKVILASTKDYSHRIYIGQDIYAEVTLRYSSKERSFTSLEHTYFDFRSDIYKNLFTTARELLRQRLKVLRVNAKLAG